VLGADGGGTLFRLIVPLTPPEEIPGHDDQVFISKVLAMKNYGRNFFQRLIMKTTPDRQPRESTAPPMRTGKRTLLVVDDDEGPRKSLQLFFRDDYEVLLAESGPKL